MRTLYVTTNKKAKEWFAVKPTTNGKKLNFWHDDGKHVTLYTFRRCEKYNQHMYWNERICRELLEELRKPVPALDVVRFAVDGVLYLADPEATPEVPAMPPKTKEQLMQINEWNNAYIRVNKEDAKCAKPAPYILYGVFPWNEKEYAWRLTPDKPKRQGIKPGDWVLVWTRAGFRTVRVTRIEEAGDKPQPECRVKRKIEPQENKPA